ncbi:hypothetical protein ACFQ61_17640 [Streptomyces sp. NPDC056500]|uniref:hypothetical protein n=1 Tax=Streptomyces sp. NPDC056500 TaxID=3345840 RepID=UPI0036B0B559
MRKSRLIGLLMAIMATLGMAMVTAPPAAASAWNPMPSGPKWCSAWESHTLTTNVVFRVCVFDGSLNYAQPVLEVRNDGPSAIRMKAWVDGNWSAMVDCPDTYLSSGYSSSCLGTTGVVVSGEAEAALYLYSASTWHYDNAIKVF